ALFRAFFLDVRDIGDMAALADVAVESGLNREAVQRYLQSTEGADEVRSEDASARQLGISGVPFFVFAGKYAVSGAQEAEVLVQAYEQAASEASDVSVVDA
ncbi:MAG: DsbA family protein, partial [Burkholderiales bacterium]